MYKHKPISKYAHNNINYKKSPFIKLKSHFSSHFYSRQSAFTIVELLVVIVVIGILAALVFVSYSGITAKATEAVIKSDLGSNSTLLKLYQAETGSYPAALDANNCPTLPVPSTSYCLKASSGNTLSYTGNNQSFSLIETNTASGISYTVTESGAIAETVPPIPPKTFAYAWGGTGEDYAYSIIATADGGYVMAGVTSSLGVNPGDAFIARFDSDGNLVWDRTWGGQANSIVAVADGGFVVAGGASLAKFASDGTFIWNKTWVGVDSYNAVSITITADGGYAIAGTITKSSPYTTDAFLAKFTSEGALVWDKTWGGSSGDYATSITTATDGDIVIAGRTYSSGTYDDAFLAKFKSNGELVWDKTWGGNVGSEQAKSIVATADGGCVIAGTARINTESNDAFIAKFNSIGELVWDKIWGDIDFDQANFIVATVDGGYAIAGWTYRYLDGEYNRDFDAFITKFDSNGALVWDKAWGDFDYDDAMSITTSADGSLAIAGATWSFGIGDSGDALIVKFSADGNIDNCSAQICQDLDIPALSSGFLAQDVGASESSPGISVSDLLASVGDPTASILDIIQDSLPPPPITVSFSGQELYVAYPGVNQTVCKQWMAPSGTIKGFVVNQATENRYDFVKVSVDGVVRYYRSGTLNKHINITNNPGATIEICIIADAGVQNGFGGEITGLIYN